MLQLKNRTPFAAQLALFPNKEGIDTLYIIVKASLNLGEQWTLADEQEPPVAADEYWSDDPSTSSIKAASDMHIGKPSTDVIMLGQACAENERKVTQLDASLSVGSISKTIRVFGDRVWDSGRISPPRPFTSMPLVYEKAFGGIHIEQDKIIAGEARNPVGCGFAGKRKARDMDGQPVPNLEDPRKLLQQLGDVVNPAGFGVIAPNWQPRISYAGTYDEAWQKSVAPYLPKDFDSRFFNMAHPDMVYPGYLQGGEPVSIHGMHPNGPLNFTLPLFEIHADVVFNSCHQQPPFNLETLILEPNLLSLKMVWKAAIPCDKQALKIKEVIVSLAGNHRQQAA